MKTKITLFGLSLFFSLQTFSQSPNWLWAKSAGGTSDDYARSVTADASGNIIATGYFSSPSITFGSTTLTNADNTGNTADIFIVKYDAAGNVLWAKSAGGTSNEYAYSVTTDALGNIIAAGIFNSSTITFGSTTLSGNMFIVKYDASGNVLWAQSSGGSWSDYLYSVTSDVSGNIIAAGYFASPSITFGSTTLTLVGGWDMFIVKYDAAGNVLWAKSAGGTTYDVAYSVTADASGNIIAAGYFDGSTLTFGSTTLFNTGNDDMFIVKYDAAGNVLWAKSAGGTNSSYEYARSVTADASGNIIAAGYFNSTT
ncbi:MAG: hypothetical protein JJE25_03715, partial [Bacteroidia bacterium]|nr:hypothetical protein [Bacteroidia bacterium]